MRPPLCFHVAHHVGNPRDAGLDAALGGDLVGHEREAVAIALAELRRDADALDAADDGVARAHVAQLAAQRAAAFDHDDRVHPLLLDLEPLPAVPHERPLVRRRVEVVGHAAVLVRLDDERVVAAGNPAAERHEPFEHLLQRGLVGPGDAHRDERRLFVGPADRESQDLERGVALDDRVENDVQELRIDQMAFGLDHLRQPFARFHGVDHMDGGIYRVKI